MSITTIDTRYLGMEQVAAAYLIREGDEAAFVEVNTTSALPRLLEALEASGASPEQVRWVIVTHAHLDHAGGAWAVMERCPNATLLAHPRAAPHLIDPSKLERSARQVYGDETFDALYGALKPIDASRVRTMDDEEELAWGSRTLRFLHTRGHANHHFCIVDSGTNTVFTGDAFGLCYPALQSGGRWVFPSTSPTDFDGPAAIASVERIVATGAEAAWLTHFGRLDDLAGAAVQLTDLLQKSTALAEEADAAGLEGEALEAHCREAVRSWFAEATTKRGLSGPEVDELLALDIDLNAQGVAFAVTKARYKRSRG